MKVAPCPSDNESGIGSMRFAAVTTSSEKPPAPTGTNTRRPSSDASTPGPVSVTVPVTSLPGLHGTCGLIW